MNETPAEILKRRAQVEAEQQRTLEAPYKQALLNEFSEGLKELPKLLVARSYVDCDIIRWKGQDFAGFSFLGSGDDGGDEGLDLAALLGTDGEVTYVSGLGITQSVMPYRYETNNGQLFSLDELSTQLHVLGKGYYVQQEIEFALVYVDLLKRAVNGENNSISLRPAASVVDYTRYNEGRRIRETIGTKYGVRTVNRPNDPLKGVL